MGQGGWPGGGLITPETACNTQRFTAQDERPAPYNDSIYQFIKQNYSSEQ